MEEDPKNRSATELPSYSLDEEDQPNRWRAWLKGWRLAVLLTLAALVAVLGFGAKPAYREIKARRALELAEQAGAAIDRGDGAAASALLRQAALMSFADERVEERVTFHAARAGDMASVAKLGEKLAGGKASTEEILVFGERSLAAGKTDDAARAAAAATSGLVDRDAARLAMLRASVLRAQGQADQGKAALREAIARLPASDAAALRIGLANWLLSESGQEGRTEAERLLEEAAENEGPDGATALRLLAANRAQQSQPTDQLVARLRSHPASTAQDELLIARLVSSDPSRKGEAGKTLVARLKERNAAIDDRVAAARWLIGLEAYEEVLDLVAENEPAEHAGALMVRLDALGGLKRWDECAKLVESNRGGTVPDTLYYLLSARMAQERGDPLQEEENKRALRQSITHANVRHVLFAARYAETCGWKPEAFAAWRVLADNNEYAVEALRGQLRNLPQAMPAEDAAEIAADLLARQPNDPSARLSAAYYRLMANEQVKASAEMAEEMLAAEPESVDVRRVVALARLRDGRGSDGLAIWPGDNGEDRWRALHVALLRAGGQAQLADEAARGVDLQRLSIEERDLLRQK